MRLPFNDNELSEIVNDFPENSITHKSSNQEREPVLTNSLDLTPLKDLLSEPDEEVDWIVDGLLAQGGLSLVVAKPKTGKSTLARQLALCVSREESFLGRSTVKGLVMYFALEERRADVRKHFKDMGASDENIKIFAKMAPTDVMEQIRKVAETEKPTLIIVDTLARITRIKNLNDYSEVIAGLQPILALAREVGSHVCLLHHGKKGDGKGIDSALGSTGITGTVDTIILLQRSEKFRTISTIQRIGNEMPESVLEFDSETRTTTLGESKEQTEISQIGKAILEFINKQEESVTEKIIDEAIEGNRSYRKKALRLLVGEGQITRIGDGKKNSPYFYSTNTGLVVSPIYTEPENQKQNSHLTPQNQNNNSGFDQIDYETEERLAIQNEGGENDLPI